MLDQARTEIARLVVTTTERVLAKKLSDADRAAYNEAAAKELTALNSEGLISPLTFTLTLSPRWPPTKKPSSSPASSSS